MAGLLTEQDNSAYNIKLTQTEVEQFTSALQMIKTIQSVAPEASMSLVGGACRDLMARNFFGTKVSINDLDFSIFDSNQIGLDQQALTVIATKLKQEGYAIIEELKFLHIKAVKNGMEFEFSSPRKEEYSANSRKPETVVGAISDDYERRDFTINAIYLNILSVGPDYVVVEPANEYSERGIQDIKKRVLTTTDDPARIFNDDPLRIMRAIRFMGYGYNPTEDIKKAIKEFPGDTLKQKVSVERISDEFIKILKKGNVEYFIKEGFIGKIIPEFLDFEGKDYAEETLEHIAQVVLKARELGGSSDLFLVTALLHDIGKSGTGAWNQEKSKFTYYSHDSVSAELSEQILKKLKFPVKLISRAKQIISFHMKIKSVKTWGLDKVIKFILTTEKQGQEGIIKDIILFNKIDWAGKPQSWQQSMNTDTEQEGIEKTIFETMDKVNKIKEQYKQDLSDIAAKIGQNKNIPVEQKQAAVLGEKTKFIVSKIKEIG